MINIFRGFPQTLTQSRSTWQEIRQLKVVNLSEKFTMVSVAVQLIVLALVWRRLPSAVPLWFSLPWGEQRLANPFWLLLLPVDSYVWFMINRFAATTLTYDHPIFTRVLFLTGMLVSVLSLLVIINIIFLVT